jgi:hypothetical protein
LDAEKLFDTCSLAPGPALRQQRLLTIKTSSGAEEGKTIFE